jgi:hypothetical protein
MIVKAARTFTAGLRQGPASETAARSAQGYRHPDRGEVISDELGSTCRKPRSTARPRQSGKFRGELIVIAAPDPWIEIKGPSLRSVQIETTTSDSTARSCGKLAKLSGGVAVIKVGRPPRRDKEKEAAPSRTRQADPRGPWRRACHRGGVAYVNVIHAVEALMKNAEATEDRHSHSAAALAEPLSQYRDHRGGKARSFSSA